MEIRLQKYLAECSVASRRGAEKMISDGRVSVNGTVVRELGTKLVGGETVTVDGREVSPDNRKVYIMLNKPTGYVTTAGDEHGRPTVMELVSDIKERIYPVGRLDRDTSGLLFMTNDGDFAYRLTHPKYQKKKVYIALVTGTMLRRDADRLERGVVIDGKKTAPATVDILEHKSGSTLVKITIHEGRNRQVRKMCLATGHRVITLCRKEVDGIVLGNLPSGKWRHLGNSEIKKLLGKDDKYADNKS